jgi:hypothetical protein
MLRLDRFAEASARDLTGDVLDLLPSKCVERGDLCVFEARDHAGRPYLFAAFHGDSAGRATCPALLALHRLAREHYPVHALVCGLDANTTRPRPARGGGGGGGGGGDGAALTVPELQAFLAEQVRRRRARRRPRFLARPAVDCPRGVCGGLVPRGAGGGVAAPCLIYACFTPDLRLICA